jgi:hypothetical protein
VGSVMCIRVRIKFGSPLTLVGDSDDYTSLAQRVEAAVRAL